MFHSNMNVTEDISHEPGEEAIPFPAREHKGHPHIEQKEYSEFSHYDQDSQAGLRTDKILHARDISRRNLSPEQLSELLDRGYVVILRRAWRGEIPLMLLFVFAVIAAFYIMLFGTGTPLFLLPLLLPGTILAALLHRRFNRRYVLTAGSISVTKGIIGFLMSELRSEYEKIRSVEVRKDLLQRILYVGDVAISTALIDQPELEMVGVPNPSFYTTFIRLRAEQFLAKQRANQIP